MSARGRGTDVKLPALLQRIFVKDFVLKLWSLMLAVVLWYAIQGEGESETFVQVGVQIKSRPPDLIITNNVVDKINLLVRGPQARLRRLKNAPPDDYVIDLANSGPGSTLFRVFAFDFRMPKGVEITRINPQIVTVVLERQKHKRLPVRINYQGELENGFVLEQATVEPDTVVIAGAESELDSTAEILTREIPLKGLRRDLSERVPLQLKSGVNSWFEGESRVQVELKISERQATEMMEGVAIEAMGEAAGRYRLEPAAATLVVQGPAGMVNDYRRNPPRLFVNLAAAKGSARSPNLEVAVEYEVAAPCEVVKIIPDKVKLLPAR